MNIVFLILLFLQPTQNEKIRVIEYNGNQVKTTFDVESRFLGTYTGAKQGYLELSEDGTGKYRYDVFGFALPDCANADITFEWGFLIDADNQVVKFEREYGYSYPILYKSTSAVSFQGCRKKVMLDFIIEQGETLSISSSDDWQK